MLKSVTWTQVAVVALLLGFTFAAYRYLGESAAAATGALTVVVAFLSGRSDDAS